MNTTNAMNTNSMTDIAARFADPAYAAGAVSLLLVFCGYVVLTKMKPDSPFASYALQILGLTFILPIVLLAGILLKVESQAVVGLLGTIIGYIFGTSKVQGRRRKRHQQPTEDEDDAD